MQYVISGRKLIIVVIFLSIILGVLQKHLKIPVYTNTTIQWRAKERNKIFPQFVCNEMTIKIKI